MGRSFKFKMKTRDRRKDSPQNIEKAEHTRRSHREKELSASKWKPGSSDVAPDARPAKANLLKGRKMMKMKTVKGSQGQDEFKSQEQPKSQEQSKSREQPKSSAQV